MEPKLLLLAEPFDPQMHFVARLQEDRRLVSGADARGRSRDDHVAGLQRHHLAEIADDMRHPEDHLVGRAGLAAFAVDVEEQRKVLRILHLVGGDQPGPERTEGVAALTLGPLTAALDLPFTLGDVVGEDVAGDVAKGVRLGDILRRPPDHDAELDLPVQLLRFLRDDHRAGGAGQRAGRLHEDDRLLRDRVARLSRVVAVVQPDRHDLPNAHEGRAHARRTLNLRQRRRIDLAQAIQPVGPDRRRRQVGDDRGEIADRSRTVEHAGLFGPGRAVAQELHRFPLG